MEALGLMSFDLNGTDGLILKRLKGTVIKELR